MGAEDNGRVLFIAIDGVPRAPTLRTSSSSEALENLLARVPTYSLERDYDVTLRDELEIVVPLVRAAEIHGFQPARKWASSDRVVRRENSSI